MKHLFKLSIVGLLLPLLSVSCASHNYFVNTDKYRVYDETFHTTNHPYSIRKVPALANRGGDFICGFDGSMIYALEELGAKYYDYDNVQYDPFKILKNHGVNTIRLRLYVNYEDAVHIHETYTDLPEFDKTKPETYQEFKYPSGGKLNLENVIKLGQRVKQNDLYLLLDIYYSDYWADPGHQYMPISWYKEYKDASDKDAYMENKVKTYTTEVLKTMNDAGCCPDYVQVGNEINSGILYPYAWVTAEEWSKKETEPELWENKFINCAKVLNTGFKAIKDYNKNIKTIIHHSQFLNTGIEKTEEWKYEYSFKTWFLDQMKAKGLNFDNLDIIGSSFYKWEDGSCDTPIYTIPYAINYFYEKFQKPLLVMETGYGFTHKEHDYISPTFTKEKEIKGQYPATIKGQTDALVDLMEAVGLAKDSHGLGVCYWGGEWLPIKGVGVGGPWDPNKSTTANQALFTYDGLALPTLSVFNNVF